MSEPNILSDTTPVLDDATPGVVHSVITDAWGLYFAQGGVVMAAALRAMAAQLDRPDLALTSASATFCRPVACGAVRTGVRVLRDGRRGSQVQGLLTDRPDGDIEASVAVNAVFTNPELAGPSLSPLRIPEDLRQIPVPERDTPSLDNSFPLGFLDNTEWRVATSAPDGPTTDGAPPRLALWFRFNNPPASPGDAWEPALLPIPGDSLGSALTVALAGGEHPVGSVSLQIDLQVLGEVRGQWIGIDSTCTHVGKGLAQGFVHLWSEHGEHVATVSQTALLRGFDG